MKCVILAILVGMVVARKEIQIYNNIPGLEKCGPCNTDECERPKGCVAGTVKDRCGCCDVCAKRQYELCQHDSLPLREGIFSGRCGDNLDCRIPIGQEKDSLPQAICYCRIKGALCGTDNITYENLCALMAQGIPKGVEIKTQGPCDEEPGIVSPPENVKDIPGSAVSLICEARGFPIPTVEWTWTRVDGKTIYLPSDDLRVSVNMRGGPEKWQVTGWLQILDLHKDHEGDYTCVAQNIHGMHRATARINVKMEKENQKKTRSRSRNN